MKFILRRDENNDYRLRYTEIKQVLDNRQQEYLMLKSGLALCQDQLKKLESKTPAQYKIMIQEL